MTQLDEAVTAAILAHDDDPEWIALVVAAARLGRAFAAFEHAKDAYVAAPPPPPGGWPTRTARGKRTS